MGLNFEPVPYEEAARIVAEKQIMSKAAFDALCDELKARAFTVAGLEDLNAVQEIRDAIAELPMGAAWEDVKAQVAEKLEAGGFSKAAADHRATLLLRHHGFAAYAQENYRELREMQDSFPYWKYQTMGDEKVRSSHAALDGLILPADDPFWRDHFPPWEWNCRCQVVGVTQEEYDAAKTPGNFNAADPDAKAAGWKLTPAQAERLRQGQLDDGSGQPASVLRKGSLHFDPSGPGLDMAEIEKRYNPGDWAKFRERMEAEKLADGRSVWDWANGVKPHTEAQRDRGTEGGILGNKPHAETRSRGEGEGEKALGRPQDPPAMGEPPAVRRELREAATEIWKKTQVSDGVEYLAAVDYKTGERFGETVRGTKGRVTVGETLVKAKAEGKQLALVHSHPEEGGVPSEQDVEVMLENSDVARRLDVVEADGTYHAMGPGKAWEKATPYERGLLRAKLQLWSEELTYDEWVRQLSDLAKEGFVNYAKNEN